MLRQQEEQVNKNEFLYRNFINSLKSKTTKVDYTRRLKYFFEFLGIDDGQYSAIRSKKRQKNDRNRYQIFPNISKREERIII